MELIHSCVHNDPIMRVHASKLVRSLGELVKTFPSSFANRIDVLKRVQRDQEEKQHLKEELQQKEQEILSLVKKLNDEIEQLKQQNCELIEQNRALQSEKSDLEKQIARDEEAMTSTIRLLKHTVEQKQHQFDDRSRPLVDNLSQQSQSVQTPISDQKIDTSDQTITHSAPPTSDTKEEKQTSTQHASNDKWEVDLSTLAITEMIGEGFFCKTYKGVLNGTTQVAVRTPVLGQVSATNLEEEAAVMKQLSGHPNVVKLCGTYLSKAPLYLIIEYMPLGTLY